MRCPSASLPIGDRDPAAHSLTCRWNIIQYSVPTRNKICSTYSFPPSLRWICIDSPKITLLHKTLKAARLAIAGIVILNLTNTELLAANTQKKQRAARTGIQYDSQSARVLSMKDVENRRQLAENKRRLRRLNSRRKKKNRTIVTFFRHWKNYATRTWLGIRA